MRRPFNHPFTVHPGAIRLMIEGSGRRPHAYLFRIRSHIQGALVPCLPYASASRTTSSSCDVDASRTSASSIASMV